MICIRSILSYSVWFITACVSPVSSESVDCPLSWTPFPPIPKFELLKKSVVQESMKSCLLKMVDKNSTSCARQSPVTTLFYVQIKKKCVIIYVDLIF